MLSIFKKFKRETLDFSSLETDMHSHLIPGIDDGAKTIDKSIAYIKGLKKLGFQRVITTPHIMGEHYPNTPQIIEEGLCVLKNALLKEQIDIEITAAAEYFIDDYFIELLDSDEPLLTLPGNRLLIEFSTFAPPANFFDILFRLKTKGYYPILAHPERYVYYVNQFEIFKEFKKKGCILQLNLLSLVGHYGVVQKKLAQKLMEAQLIDFAGTDLHHGGHLETLKKVLNNRQVQRYLKSYPFLNKELN